MRRRLLVLFCVFALLVIGAGLAAVLFRPTHRINRENCEQIEVGMMQQQVEALLGGPPGDYRTGEVALDLREVDDGFHSIMTSMEVLLGERRFRHEWWQGDKGTLWVCFDEDDRVIAKNLTPGRSTSTFWAKVRRGLGL